MSGSSSWEEKRLESGGGVDGVVVGPLGSLVGVEVGLSIEWGSSSSESSARTW